MGIINKAHILETIEIKHMLIISIILMLIMFWPGWLSPDSLTIYNFAKQLKADEYAPMLILLWGVLDKIYSGGGLIFLVQVLLLYGGLFYYTKLLPNKKITWLFLAIPVIPVLLVYFPFIWKDNQLTFSYVFIMGMLTHKLYKNKKFHWLEIMLAYVILFYATGVKYQAKFILPFVCLFLAVANFKNFKVRTWIFAIISWVVIYGSCTFIINALAVKQQSNHWQYAKFYDLAGISVYENKVLVPDIFCVGACNLNAIKSKYTYYVNPLVDEKDSPLRKIYNTEEGNILKTAWHDNVKKYFLSYLQHRLHIFLLNITDVPGKNSMALYLKNAGMTTTFSRIITFFSFAPLLLVAMVGVIYVVLNFKASKMALPLLFHYVLILAWSVIMFFFTLSATARYCYFAMYLSYVALVLFAIFYSEQKAINHKF